MAVELVPGGLSRSLPSIAAPTRMRVCPLCVVVSAVGLILLGVWAFHRGDARPERLRAEVQTVAAERLKAAGYPWASLSVVHAQGQLVGEAPDTESQQALRGAVGRLLGDLVGMPGVVSHIEDRTALSTCGEQLHGALGQSPVRFDAGLHALDPATEPMLAALARASERCPTWRIVIDATIDRSAHEQGMRRLGQRRAQAIAAALMLQGVPVERIESRAGASADARRTAFIHVENDLQRP